MKNGVVYGTYEDVFVLGWLAGAVRRCFGQEKFVSCPGSHIS